MVHVAEALARATSKTRGMLSGGGTRLRCSFGHAAHRPPHRPEVGAEQSESFPCARTESRKSEASNFTPIDRRVVG
jgi:hypothetical protein